MFLGYQLMTYGFSQVRGSNAGFFDILWPGRYKGAFPDGGSTSTTGQPIKIGGAAVPGTITIPAPSGSGLPGGPGTKFPAPIPQPSGSGL